MGMDHMNPAASGNGGSLQNSEIGEGDPFDDNPFMNARLQGINGVGIPPKRSKDHTETDPRHDGDDGEDMEGIIESDLPENDDGEKTPPPMILSEPPQSTDDYGYEKSLRRQRIRNRIIIIMLGIAVIASVVALVWSITINPLHLFEKPNSDNAAYSEEYRGSQCRIDGQSCSSDDNGNNPSN